MKLYDLKALDSKPIFYETNEVYNKFNQKKKEEVRKQKVSFTHESWLIKIKTKLKLPN